MNPEEEGEQLMGAKKLLGQSAGSGHGSLDGLGDDDHTQYHTDARAESWITALTSITFDGAITFVSSDSEDISLDSARDVILQPSSGNGVFIGYSSQNADAPLHVAKGFGTVPSLVGREVALFQNNNDISDDCYVTILAGEQGGSTLSFADASDQDVGALIYDHYNDDLNVRVNAAQRLTIKSTGRVGVATASPSCTLDVNGDIRTRGDYYSSDNSQGWTGTFTNGGGDTVTVKNGIITDVS